MTKVKSSQRDPAEPRRDAQLAFRVEETLRARLKAAARESVRSLSGEIVKRLRDSFAEQADAA